MITREELQGFTAQVGKSVEKTAPCCKLANSAFMEECNKKKQKTHLSDETVLVNYDKFEKFTKQNGQKGFCLFVCETYRYSRYIKGLAAVSVVKLDTCHTFSFLFAKNVCILFPTHMSVPILCWS